MKKICFYGSFNGRGTERATVDLAGMLNDSYSIYILNTANTTLTYKINGNTIYKTLNSNGVGGVIISLRNFIKKYEIDILIAVEALSGITALPATLFTKAKLIIWDHGNYFQNKGSKYMHITRKIELLFCSAYIVLTNRDEKLYRQHFKFIRTRLQRIYNAVEVSQHNRYDLTSKTIISVGHIDKNKNFLIIPEIASRIFEDHQDWIWKIYGTGNESDVRELQGKINEYGMQNNIILCDFVSDVGRIYSESSFVVMTSIYEGFPLVLIEAKSYGLPIISFDIDTGPDEIVRHGVNGFLIGDYNVNEMACKIAQLIEDSELRKVFSNNSYLDLEMLHPSVIKKQWNQLLCEI